MTPRKIALATAFTSPLLFPGFVGAAEGNPPSGSLFRSAFGGGREDAQLIGSFDITLFF